ncbi:acyltransferase [Candidatus Roizmanbacteria bacterium]|nr:acyltransferase [Candidatus Roizmanbacteria bacterium]
MDRMRQPELDFLRGIAILVMIFIHSLAYYLSRPAVFTLWNYSHFVVPVFIFVSSTLFFQKDRPASWPQTLSYIKKRLFRLLLPYYIFLAFLFGLYFIFEKTHLTGDFIFRSLLVIGGVDINWMVLLFLLTAIIMPLLSYLACKRRLFFNAVGAVSVVSTVFLLFYRVAFDYRVAMLLPWLTVVFFGYYFPLWQRQKKIKFVLPILIGIHLGTYILLKYLHLSLVLFDNKYPPNIYYLSYGLSVTIVLNYFINSKAFLSLPVKRLLNFISKNSYSVFFIHFLVIYIISKVFRYTSWHWLIFFGAVLVVTLLLQRLFQYVSYLVKVGQAVRDPQSDFREI